MLAATGAAVAAMALPAFAEPAATTTSPFHISLNTSTIRGQARPLPEEVDIAAQCGYDAIEPWLGEIEKYVQGGGSLPDLRKRISDAGLTVESSIAFFAWIVDDDAKRAAALEVAKRQMDLVAQIGGKRIAAPPVGATDVAIMDRHKIAERYAALIDLGQSSGIVPELEIWGPSKTLGRLDEAIEVERAANRPQACLLLDIYHLYKGNSDLSALRTLKPTELHVIHVNDYPADPPRETIKDSFRVYPGDGVAPLGDIFRTLRDIGFNGYLSVELFNRDYWKQNPLKTAQIAIDKTRAAVAKALG
jgi:sugar phosphate isomerase/epimerase